MRKISEIYREYKINRTLQEHMFRVSAVASVICDNFIDPLSEEKKNEIITTCLLHDMGNILKFQWDLFAEFFEPEGIEYWKKVHKEFKEKYGNNEHEATVKIINELGLSSKIAEIVARNRFSLICENANSNDMHMKILSYADGRVNPYGVVSYEERMEEAKERYKKINRGQEEERLKLVACGKEIEKQVFEFCKIKPEDINNERVAPVISGLRDFVIHSTASGSW